MEEGAEREAFRREIYMLVASGERSLLTRDEMAESLTSVAEDIRPE